MGKFHMTSLCIDLPLLPGLVTGFTRTFRTAEGEYYTGRRGASKLFRTAGFEILGT
jgi:hypothetical protein